MRTILTLSLMLSSGIVYAAPAATAATPASTTKASTDSKSDTPSAPMDPEVKKIVDTMQAFYEKTQDYEAHFDQTYHYASFNRTQQSSGTMLFKKPALMRWDYEKPSKKIIVLAGDVVYMYDVEADEVTKAPLKLDRLSASVTFLLGQGKLADEFNIKRANRPEWKDAVALELTPKRADPRFKKVFFRVDPKTNAVTETIVVDPDDSENHMVFSHPKVDQNVGAERFHFEPSKTAAVKDLTQMQMPRPQQQPPPQGSP
jgi:outer membrane lipoprotein carrier protein